MAIWLWHTNEMDTETFLANDDFRTYYHHLRWLEEAPKVLSELCSRIINRNLFKALDVHRLSNEHQLEALAKARDLVEKKGHDPDRLCTLRHQKIESYQPYKKGLRLWDGENLKALEQVSQVVQGLIDPVGASWLIHPKEIHEDLKEEISFLPSST